MRTISCSTRLFPAAVFAVLAVVACSPDANQANPTSANFEGLGGGSPGEPSANRQDSSGGTPVFGVGKGGLKETDEGPGGGTGIGVNAFLWRGALDTIAFMPLTSADPFGGVIITDWYTPPGTSGERFKATIYILSRDLRSDGLRVNIYRQVLQNGQWTDAAVAESTIGDIENKVLVRARHMREQLQASS